MFQCVQSIALAMAQEFGFTREIEDRVQAPCPIWLVAMAKVLSGAAQGVLSAIIVLPIASVVHASGVHAHLTMHAWVIFTLVPLACIAMAGLGLVLGTSFEPRNIGLMFGFIILPITFLGGTYYSWTKLAPVKIGGFHWLQTLVLINPLIYVNEGMRAAFTRAPHMHLYVIYPVIIGFAAVFLTIGLRNFRRRVPVLDRFADAQPRSRWSCRNRSTIALATWCRVPRPPTHRPSRRRRPGEPERPRSDRLPRSADHSDPAAAGRSGRRTHAARRHRCAIQEPERAPR